MAVYLNTVGRLEISILETICRCARRWPQIISITIRFRKNGPALVIKLSVLLPASLYLQSFIAQVAELVDAADSKSAVRKNVLVRFQSWAPDLRYFLETRLSSGFFWFCIFWKITFFL